MPLPNNFTCSTMIQYSESWELRISLLINWLILIPAFPILVYSLYQSIIQKIFHKNTQVQIFIHLVALLMHCFGRFVLHSLDLWNYFKPYQNGCEILPNFYRCLIFRFLYNFGQATISMTPISVTIERFIAVRYNRAYENCPFSYGVALGCLQIFLAMGYLFTRYIHAAFTPSGFTFYYCQTLVSSSITVLETVIPLYCIIISQLISIIAFKFMELSSKRLREISDINLSARFTLDQSKRSISALKSFVYCNCLMVSMITLGLSILHFFSSYFTKPGYMAIVELTHALPLYGITVCVAVWWRLRVLDGEQRRNITLSMRGHAVHADMYFKMFENQIKR